VVSQNPPHVFGRDGLGAAALVESSPFFHVPTAILRTVLTEE
jgi:hypothetical protein